MKNTEGFPNSGVERVNASAAVENVETIELSKQEAFAQITALQHEQMTTGAVSDEWEAFQHLLADLNADRISPVAALEKARTIVAGRQDYH